MEGLSAVASIPTLERRGERMLAVFTVFWWGGTWTLVTRSICFRVFVALAVSPFSPLAYLCA